jgi:hypothetical protein
LDLLVERIIPDPVGNEALGQQFYRITYYYSEGGDNIFLGMFDTHPPDQSVS